MSTGRELVQPQFAAQRTSHHGSVALVYGLPDLLREAETQTVSIYDSSDFPVPIQRAEASIGKTTVDGHPATTYSADIALSQKVNRSVNVVRDALCGRMKGLHTRGTGYANAFHVAHPKGFEALVGIYPERGIIHIVNHRISPPDEQVKTNILPPLDGTVSQADQMEGFAQTFMQTLDILHGIPLSRRKRWLGQSALRRKYVFGEDVRPFTQWDMEKPVTPTKKRRTQPTRPKVTPPPTVTTTPKPKKETEQDFDIAELFEETDETLRLDHIGGLSDVKSELRDIIMSFEHPELLEQWGTSRPQGVLLHGPPGTGKTMLVQAFANELGAELLPVQSSNIYKKWMGDSEGNMKKIFNKARAAKKKTILFFDEFDSIVSMSDKGNHETRDAVAGIVKQELNTLARDNPNVLVFLATNDKDKIDESLIRSGRIDHIIYVPLPDDAARLDIVLLNISSLLKKEQGTEIKMIGDDLSVPEICTATDGFSGADIAEIFRRVTFKKAMEQARTEGKPSPISRADIMQAVQSFRQEN